MDTIRKGDAYQLNVTYGNSFVAALTLDKTTNLLKLNYSQQWQQNGFAISPHLPLAKPHSPEVAYNYLDNALPEGEARRLLANNLGVSEKNVYSQVRAIGNDLAGAFTFMPAEQNIEEYTLANMRIVKESELIKRLDEKEEFGLLTWDDKPRLSVAGVQDKLNVFIDENGNMGFADGPLCSTHILKFEKKNCPNLVLNEFFCMQLSSAIGLPTAEVTYKRLGPHPALVVKRFDRKYSKENNKVLRRHVIDACQALNLSRDYKYERNLGDGRDVQHIRDGASLNKLFEFSKAMSSPVESKNWLIHWQLFNLMISNYDSHGKNISLYFDKTNARFTPSYDLVNIAMFPQFTQTLAMAMGDEFMPDNIHAYQLADFAETCNIDKKLLSRLLVNLAEKVIHQLNGNDFIDNMKCQPHITEEDIAYFHALRENILMKTEYLKAQAGDIPFISV
ncbi:HipA domain-containing protein [Glaciecola sp. 1036]|uniref:HipA domain-containing protein n=1 Tax=Alteromonadaceae TaxID=72275 RepID=UPI003CFC1CF9